MVFRKRGKSKTYFWLVFAFVAVSLTVGLLVCQPVSSCYGPHITASVSATEINIYENVTVTGTICLGTEEDECTELDRTVRVTFVRPDYSYIDQVVIADEETGNFTVTQALDMTGYWNIFPILGHINDRLGVVVADPNADPTTIVPIVGSPFNPNPILIVAAVTIVSIGSVFAFLRRKNKARRISALRLLIQVGLIFLIFFGMFIDHEILPVPASKIPVHEFLVGTNILGVEMADGFPVPFFGCYYPCGRTVTCVLWELQTSIFPFWEGARGWGVDYNTSGLVRLGVIIAVTIVLAVIVGKAFCGWVCPFGLYMDLLTYLRKMLKIPHKNFSEDFNAKFHQLGYIILALLIVISFMFGAEAIIGSQLVPGTEEGGFMYQYFAAPFCQFCPMKPLGVLLESSVGLIRFEWITQVTTGTFFELGYYVTSLNLFVLVLVTVVSFYYRRAWCRICPLGALLAIFNRFPPFKRIAVLRLEKLEEKCTKCGICKRVCPTQVTEVYDEKGGDVTTSNCTLCLRCLEMCPEEDALTLKAAGKTIVKSRNWLESEKLE